VGKEIIIADIPEKVWGEKNQHDHEKSSTRAPLVTEKRLPKGRSKKTPKEKKAFV